MLTDDQRAKLRKTLEPLIKEALTASVGPMVKEELKDVLAEIKDSTRSYTDQILSARDQEKLVVGNDKGFGVARIARCIAMANNDPERAAHIASELYDDDLGEMVQKVLSSGDADAGGAFVPEVMAESFIDALRATAVVRGTPGMITIDLTGGNLRLPKVVTDPTAGWVGENAARNASNLATGSLNFAAKTLQGKSAITQALLRRSGQSVETIVRDSLVRVMANTEDIALLEGLGTENSPKGMLNWAIAANLFDANATVNLTNVQADLRLAMSRLTDLNVPIALGAWFMSMRTRNFLAFSLRDTEDRPAFKDELTSPTPSLNGQIVRVTNNIPNNLGAGTDESKVYFTAMEQAWLAEEGGLRIRASTEASFADSTGTTVSAFDQGLMVIIIERDEDFVMAHGEAVSVIEALTWGA